MLRLSEVKRLRSSRGRIGFTLTELLVVIAIIGILAGIAIPGVMMARNSIVQGAAKMNLQNLDDAVEKYRSKYGDYPPDGGSWTTMEAHLRKAFPNILQSELNLLNPAYRTVAVPGYPPGHVLTTTGNRVVTNDYLAGRVMDPAEALVFFLGGFSTDSQKPFTGKGGPFVLNGTAISYNVGRENPMFEFESGRLAFDDEAVRHVSAPLNVPDLLPVYLAGSTATPFVYFDSRSYITNVGNIPIVNFHCTQIDGFDNVKGSVSPLLAANAQNPRVAGELPRNRFLNPKKFQILGPGMDGNYGGAALTGTANQPIGIFAEKGTFHAFDPSPSGTNSWFPLVAPAPPGNFYLTGHGTKRPVSDNMANCISVATLQQHLVD